MKNTRTARAGQMAVLLVTVARAGAAQGDPGLQVAVFGRGIQPGEVIGVDVTCSCGPGPAVATATAFGKVVTLFAVPNAAVWRGLIGIDVETKPGVYPVTIVVDRLGEPPLTTIQQLRVVTKLFPTRRLRVADRFVSPPPAALERIRRETQRLEALFEGVTSGAGVGPFLVPVSEPATPNFGARSVFDRQVSSLHRGIDFRSPPGTPVAAPGAGIVVLAEALFFTGNTVIIDHGLGLYSVLAHLATVTVAAGDRTHPGQIVGLVGSTGRVTGPHLHWGVRLNGARVDPLSLLVAVETASAR